MATWLPIEVSVLQWLDCQRHVSLTMTVSRVYVSAVRELTVNVIAARLDVNNAENTSWGSARVNRVDCYIIYPFRTA